MVLLQIFRGHRSTWLPLLSACHFVELDTSFKKFAMCLHFYILFLSQDKFLVLLVLVLALKGKKFDRFC